MKALLRSIGRDGRLALACVTLGMLGGIMLGLCAASHFYCAMYQ
jgi:hypothetical protein